MLYCMNRLKVFANLKSCFVISFSVFCIIPFLQQRELLLPHSMFGVLHCRFMQQNQEIIDHNWIETVKVSMPMCARYMTKYPRQFKQADMGDKDFECLTFFRPVKNLVYKHEKCVLCKTDCKKQEDHSTEKHSWRVE